MSVVVNFKKEDGIVFIKLNRPDKRNALNPDMIQLLLSFFQKEKWDNFIKAVVISGEGKAFCSGADLKWLGDESLFTKQELENLFSLFEAMESAPVPIVALVHGFAVGGGLGLLSVSDVIIVEENSQFCFSETKLGLVPSIISPFVLRKIGLSQARFLMLSALTFSAQKAKEIDLAHFVGTKEECDTFLNKLLDSFKKLDPIAVGKTKAWLNSISSLPVSQCKEEGVFIISSARKTDSAKKRIKKLLSGSSTKE